MTILYARIRARPPLLLPSCSEVDGDGPKYTANAFYYCLFWIALDLRMIFLSDLVTRLIRPYLICNSPMHISFEDHFSYTLIHTPI